MLKILAEKKLCPFKMAKGASWDVNLSTNDCMGWHQGVKKEGDKWVPVTPNSGDCIMIPPELECRI